MLSGIKFIKFLVGSIFSHRLTKKTTALIVVSSLIVIGTGANHRAIANSDYCQFSPNEIATKEQLLKDSLTGSGSAGQQYQAKIAQHASTLQQCRSSSWLKNQAIWLRLYPCDARPGRIEAILDRIVNRGYNQVYLEVFYDSRVLLPPNDNPTIWDPVVGTDTPNDLLAETIELGHQRGLKVYAWLFTLNYGYSYGHNPQYQETLARNGRGQTSLTFVEGGSQAFVDPYNREAQINFYRLVDAVVKRRPDGVLFDYIRYPRGSGSNSVVSNVKDLWIYSEASRQALYNRAANQKGLELIKRYLSKGEISLNDVVAVDSLYPNEAEPLWQGRNLSASELKAAPKQRYLKIQRDLWYLSVSHAAQGIIDFLNFAAMPAQKENIATGAVFFPGANLIVGKGGFDSRLQAWDKFGDSIQWHPMTYSICPDSSCIVNQVQSVLDKASANQTIVPALAGVWGKEYLKHPPLEQKMEALRRATPRIDSVSHFAYSWQEPELDKLRRNCQF